MTKKGVWPPTGTEMFHVESISLVEAQSKLRHPPKLCKYEDCLVDIHSSGTIKIITRTGMIIVTALRLWEVRFPKESLARSQSIVSFQQGAVAIKEMLAPEAVRPPDTVSIR